MYLKDQSENMFSGFRGLALEDMIANPPHLPIWDWGTMVFCRSQSGEKSRPCSCSLSPCLKNSSMHLSSTSTLEIQKSPSWFFPDHKTQKIPPVRTLWSTGCAAATSLQGGRRRKSEEALRGLAVCPNWWTHEYDYCRCILQLFCFPSMRMTIWWCLTSPCQR